MANPLHDHPRSPKAKEKQMAEKGDVKTREELGVEGDPDEELESAGALYGKGGKPRASEKDVEEREHLSLSPPGDAEVWRRRKKKDVPTS